METSQFKYIIKPSSCYDLRYIKWSIYTIDYTYFIDNHDINIDIDINNEYIKQLMNETMIEFLYSMFNNYDPTDLIIDKDYNFIIINEGYFIKKPILNKEN